MTIDQQFLDELEQASGPGYVLASYMRSGSIWVRSLLYDYDALMRNVPLVVERPPDIGQYSPSLGGMRFNHQFALGEKRFTRQIIKTHRHFEDYRSIADNKKICVLFRRASDAVASAYKKRTNRDFRRRKMSEEEWLEVQKRMKERGPDEVARRLMQGWLRHAKSYLDASADHPNIAFIGYEAFKKDPEGCLQKLVAYYDYDVSPENIRLAVENRQFSRMKDSAQSTKDRVNINQGQIGGARSMLKNETISEVDKLTSEIYETLKTRQKDSLGID